MTLEDAKDDVEIYLWTEIQIKNYIDYWDEMLKKSPEVEVWNNPVFKMSIPQKEELVSGFKEVARKEKERLEKFKRACNYNLVVNIASRISDKWDGRAKEFSYQIPIKLKYMIIESLML